MRYISELVENDDNLKECKVCGNRFALLIKNKYIVTDKPISDIFEQNTVYYEAFDCPFCGCQNIVNERKFNVAKIFETNKEE